MRILSLVSLLAIFVVATSAHAMLKNEQPLRQAQVHGTIYKTVVSYSPISVHQEKVCDVTGDVPVYGPLQADSSQSLVDMAKCQSTVKGQPVNVVFTGMMGLSNAKADEAASKMASVILSVYQPGGAALHGPAAAGSEDLSVKTLRLMVTVYAPKDATAASEESFTVYATFVDGN